MKRRTPVTTIPVEEYDTSDRQASSEKQPGCLEAALRYLRLGLRPIPILPNIKRPLTTWSEFQQRAPTETEVRGWWEECPTANVAILTGEASDIDVVDFDPGHDPWPEDGHELPSQCVVATPRGGQHFYFRHTDGVRNSTSRLAKGVDVRGDGGYVVAPPSVVDGHAYSFQIGSLRGINSPPDWLAASLAVRIGENERTPSDPLASARIPQGERNSTLTRIAGKLRRYGISEAAILTELRERNIERCDPPLREGEVRGIAESVARYRPAHPNSFDGTTFVPLRLARAIKARGTFCLGVDPERGTGQLMEYRDGVWLPAVDVDRKAQELLGESVRRNRVEETIAALRRDVPRRPWSQWNIPRQLINCANGMLDPITAELVPHSPDHYSTLQIPVSWDPRARSDRLDRFFSEILSPGEAAVAAQMVGYFATPDTSVKRLFILEGEANTGKTVFLSLVTAFVGLRNIAVVSLQDLADNRFALAQLENKLLATFDDLDSRALRSSSIPKVLTGRFDRIRVERKGRDAYSAPSYARMLFTCNRMPSCSSDCSSAWYNRILVIPFSRVIPEERQDVGLTRQLTTPEALQRMLQLAVDGLRDLIGQGMRIRETESMAKSLADYRGRTDTVAAFVDECCRLGLSERLKRTHWLREYRSWCEESKCHPLGRNTAYARLLGLGGIGDAKDADGSLVFTGITIGTTT